MKESIPTGRMGEYMLQMLEYNAILLTLHN